MQRLLRLLSDPTRLRILAALEGEELAVGEIVEVLSMSQSRISNHLRLLKEAEVLDARREGAWTFYRNTLDAHPESSAVWAAVKQGVEGQPDFRADLSRRRTVLEKRRRRSREYFAAKNGGGETGLEHDSLREELIASLLPQTWTVLDVGCGNGSLTEALAARFDRVIAVDHAPERIATARRRLEGAEIEFRDGEADDLPVGDAEVDAVFFSLVLHHVPRIAEVLSEAHRVLRPGGRVAVADFSPHHDEAMRAEMGDLRLGLDPAAIADALKQAGFEEVTTGPARDRFRTGRKNPLDLFLATGQRPARKRNSNSGTAKGSNAKGKGSAKEPARTNRRNS